MMVLLFSNQLLSALAWYFNYPVTQLLVAVDFGCAGDDYCHGLEVLSLIRIRYAPCFIRSANWCLRSLNLVLGLWVLPRGSTCLCSLGPGSLFGGSFLVCLLINSSSIGVCLTKTLLHVGFRISISECSKLSII